MDMARRGAGEWGRHKYNNGNRAKNSITTSFRLSTLDRQTNKARERESK